MAEAYQTCCIKLICSCWDIRHVYILQGIEVEPGGLPEQQAQHQDLGWCWQALCRRASIASL
jgi:hypothetical protein